MTWCAEGVGGSVNEGVGRRGKVEGGRAEYNGRASEERGRVSKEGRG